MTDEELLTRIAAADARAFGDFYDRYAARVLGFLVRLLHKRADADDVLQETFWQVWSRAGDYQSARGSVECWLFLLARSRALDCLRRSRRQAELLAAREPGETADPARLVEAQDSRGLLRRALEQLTEDQRSAIILAFYGGLSHEEIAVRQAIPLGTAKTRIRLGMQRLKRVLTEKLSASV